MSRHRAKALPSAFAGRIAHLLPGVRPFSVVGAPSISTLNPDPANYDELLDAKARRIRALLGDRLQVPLDIVASPPLHHRMKLSFDIRHDGDDLHFCMEDPCSRRFITIDEYPIACQRLGRLMVDLRAALRGSPETRRKAFQVEMLANTHGEALVCLMYHRVLEEDYAHLAAALAERVGASVVGRSRGKRIVAGPGRLVQWHYVGGRVYPQIHQELRFSQSNAHICREMLRWVAARTEPPGGSPCSDLLELYCGNGNFTLPLSANFRRVLATEVVRGSAQLAEECATWAGVDNVQFVRLSADETVRALRGERTFRRLAIAGVDLDAFDFGTVLVDPPRSGLDPVGLALVGGFPRCIYISCNPQRLAEDLAALPAHEIEAAALFDQFPYSDHAEVAVVLRRS